MKLLQNEYDELTIKTEEDMSEKLKYISENLLWTVNDVKDSRIIVAEPEKNEMPGQMKLLEDGTCGDFYNELEKVAPVSDRDAAEMVYRGSNRFAVLRDENGQMQVIPTFYTAQNGLLKRRGCFCPAITGNYAIVRPAPSTEEAFLNDSARRCKSSEKWGIIDGGCIANASEGYVVLDAFDGYNAFKSEISSTWEDVEFSNGRVSYEGYMADFEIKDEIAIDGLKNTLEELGVTVESIKAYARYTTSDVTQSAMAATIYYVLNDTPIRLASKLGVEHKGDSSIAVFSDKLKDLGMLLKESEEQVEKLGNTEIEFPANCLENALKKVHLLNKHGVEAVDEVIIDPSSIQSALDIVLRVNEVLKTTAQVENYSTTKLLNYTEEVTKLLNSKFSELDKAS